MKEPVKVPEKGTGKPMPLVLKILIYGGFPILIVLVVVGLLIASWAKNC